MKQLILGLIAVIGLAMMAHMTALAQDTPMTEAHIARIRDNCVEAQSTLRQIHASDALLRVNRGPIYESISTKLMAPLNSRISLAKADGSTLSALTATYENQLNDFRSSYKEYEESLSGVLRINCTAQPVAFYDSVNDARVKRAKVHDTTVALQKTIQDYRQAFGVFKQQFLEKNP